MKYSGDLVSHCELIYFGHLPVKMKQQTFLSKKKKRKKSFTFKHVSHILITYRWLDIMPPLLSDSDRQQNITHSEENYLLWWKSATFKYFVNNKCQVNRKWRSEQKKMYKLLKDVKRTPPPPMMNVSHCWAINFYLL